MAETRLSGKRWNRIVWRIVGHYVDLVDSQVQAQLADGYPPFTEPSTNEDQYQRLLMWRDTGDPRYWNNPAARARLEQLGQTLGAPRPLRPSMPLQPVAPEQTGAV